MNKSIISCPACGAETVSVEKVEKDISLPFGAKRTISIYQHTCSVCGMQGDFTDTNDEIISKPMKKLI
jgi:transcription elongation factor Elf1